MKKSQKVQAEDEPVMLDTFPKTLRDHTAAQHETNNEFRALIRALDTKSMSKIEVLERKSQNRYEELQSRMDSNFQNLCELIVKKGFEKCGGYVAKSETISIIEMD